MSSTIKYVQIFNLNIFHNYFLDTKVKDEAGNDILVVFDDKQKTDDLSNYNVADFLRITPSQQTKRVLANHKVVFKTTTDGAACFISVDQDDMPVIDATDVTIDLLIYSRDTSFEKYTDMNTSPKRIYFFTNDTEEDHKINVLTDEAKDLEFYKVLSGTSEYETLLSTLDGREQRSLLGIVTVNLDKLLQAGKVEDPPIEFKIVLKNRKTIWVYLDQKDGSVVSETKTPQPFMRKGNIIPIDKNDVVIPYRMATPSDAFEYPEDSNQLIKTQVYIYRKEEETVAE